MAVTARLASRVLLTAAVLTAGTALAIVTYAAVRGGPFLPVLALVLVELALVAVALGLRKQLLRQHPIDGDAPPPTDAEPPRDG